MRKMLILASESPRRRELLGRICKDFRICSADIDEISAGTDPFSIPIANARAKALKVAEQNPDSIVIGADTVIIFENEVIGKPHDIGEAALFLNRFSGKKHLVATGVAICSKSADNGFMHDYTELSEVQFKNLSQETIEKYLSLVHVLDKAGAYAFQEHGDMLIENHSGEVENIVGLPLIKLKDILQKIAPQHLKQIE